MKTVGSNQPAIEARRLRVMSMRYAGFSETEIADQLGVSLATIKRDCREIATRQLEETKRVLTTDSMSTYAWVQHTENMRRLEEIALEGDTKAQLTAVNLRRREVDTIVRIFQSMGVLVKAPEQLHITHAIAAGYTALPASVRQELREAHDTDRDLWKRLVTQHLGHLLPSRTAPVEEVTYEDVT